MDRLKYLIKSREILLSAIANKPNSDKWLQQHFGKVLQSFDENLSVRGKLGKDIKTIVSKQDELFKSQKISSIQNSNKSTICDNEISEIHSDLIDNSTEVFVNEFAPNHPQVFTLPPRPGVASEGKPIKLISNHFPLKFNMKIYCYKVFFKNSRENKNRDLLEPISIFPSQMKRQIFNQMLTDYGNIGELFYGTKNKAVFDGNRTFYTLEPLEGVQLGSNVKCNLKTDINGVQKSFMADIHIDPQLNVIDLAKIIERKNEIDDYLLRKAILALDTIVQQSSLSQEKVKIGRKFFTQQVCDTPQLEKNLFNEKISVDKTSEIRFGTYQAIKLNSKYPTLNVDQVSTIFNKGMSVCEFAQQVLNLKSSPEEPFNEEQISKLKSYMIGLKIKTQHNNYEYRIMDISSQSAKNLLFALVKKDDVQPISVEQFLETQYGISLHSPFLPCIISGSTSKPIYLPFELCDLISNQTLKRDWTTGERSKIISINALQKPLERWENLKSTVKKMQGNAANYLSEFSIALTNDPINVEGKVIDSPELEFNNKKHIKPNNGKWNMYEDTTQFYVASTLKNWIVLNFADASLNEINDFLYGRLKDNGKGLVYQGLIDFGQKMGINIEKINLSKNLFNVHDYKPRMQFIERKLLPRLVNKYTDIEMCLCVLPDDQVDVLYSEIKLVFDMTGIVTQCVKRQNINKSSSSMLSNIILKLNTKLGGINSVLSSNCKKPQIFDDNVMLIGADVHHPCIADRASRTIKSSSIASLVGTFDNELTRCFATIRVQPHVGIETIKSLDTMLLELLNGFREKRKNLPDHIVFYRDGVSSSQFQNVLREEFSQLKKAFNTISFEYDPKVTFIVVQKRHQTRFMPENATRDKGADEQNVPSGTVVDSGLVDENSFDFYLASHCGKIGTSRPAHYYVLADENNFTADDLYKLTFYTCHTYARCNSSVSIPDVVYYAHWCAYRAKMHIIAWDSSLIGKERLEDKIKKLNVSMQVSPKFRGLLYFC